MHIDNMTSLRTFVYIDIQAITNDSEVRNTLKTSSTSSPGIGAEVMTVYLTILQVEIYATRIWCEAISR